MCEGLHGEVDAVGLSERLSRGVGDEPATVVGEQVRLSVSIGIALGTDPGCDVDRLLQDADIAMYEATARGRARHPVFDETLRQRSRQRLDLKEALAGATGLIVPLGAHVLEQACRTVAAAALPLGVAVDVSRQQLADGDLAERVADTLAATGLPANRLCPEITETALMEDLPHATRTLQALRRPGVQSSLDDFGTGHATLGHLEALPVDELEIDRAFVSGLGTSDSDAQIVTAVTGLAEAFDLRVVAEGIEHAHQAHALRGLGCAHGQGYHFGRPSPGLPEAAV